MEVADTSIAAIGINEAGLVAMAALEQLGGDKAASNQDLPEEIHDEIAGAFLQHSRQLGNLRMDWKRFRESTREVESN